MGMVSTATCSTSSAPLPAGHSRHLWPRTKLKPANAMREVTSSSEPRCPPISPRHVTTDPLPFLSMLLSATLSRCTRTDRLSLDTLPVHEHLEDARSANDLHDVLVG